MLGYFPDPYPDELLYSTCARYSDVIRYPAKDAVFRELFGVRGMGNLATLPTRLDHLVSLLPSNTSYTAQQLIEEHTLFPYYAPFLPPERALALQEAMKKGEGSINTIVLAGIPSHRIPLPQWLRYCPKCVEEDRRSFGECYWHRLHQVFGVELCPFHHIFLQKSAVLAHDTARPARMFAAEHAIQHTQAQVIDPANALHQTLLQIAYDSAWLLDQHGLMPSLAGLRQRYMTLLYIQELATYNGNIHIRKLATMVREYYSPELLTLLSSQLAEHKRTTWLAYLLNQPLTAQPPIRHLLLMHLLKNTAEQFFGLRANPSPFGEGPWPCLNPVCEFYRQPVIRKVQLVHTERKPKGIFACACGFEYYRIGPDLSPDAQFRRSSVRHYGPRWEAALQTRWFDSGITLGQLTLQLGVRPPTIIHYAANLGLPFPRPGGRNTLSRDKVLELAKKSKIKTGEQLAVQRKKFRDIWINSMKEHPEWLHSTRSQKMPYVFAWLNINDREWLEENSQPQTRKFVETYQVSSKYWMELDIRLAEEIRAVGKRLKGSLARPIRITKSVIGRELHQKSRLFHQLDKLPLTTTALAEVVESPEESGIRKLWWEAERFRQDGKIPNRTQLIQKAGVDDFATHPQVNQAIETILARFWQPDCLTSELVLVRTTPTIRENTGEVS